MADSVLNFHATFDAYPQASADFRNALDAQRVNPGARYKAELVFEEIVSNVIRHGCLHDPECRVEVSIAFRESSIVLVFEDDGPPFDLRDYAVSDIPITLDDARHGGLGLLLVRKSATRIDYERTNADLNRVTITIAS